MEEKEKKSMKYTVYVGSEKTMKNIAIHGVVGLNRKTMKYQRFAKNAKLEAIKDPDVETGWMVVSDIDIRAKAKELKLIL